MLMGFVVHGLLLGQAAATEASGQTELDSAQQALLSAGLGAKDESYHAKAEGEGFLLASPNQGLTASLRGGEVEVRGSNGAAGMRFLRWGCDLALAPVSGSRTEAQANRVQLVRDGVVEWYVAGPQGIEQGFTVAAPGAGCEESGELLIEMAVTGLAVLGRDGRSLEYPEAALRYRGLFAVDSRGRDLPAHLELLGQRLVIRTEVRGAHWPVTVDPTFEVASLRSSDAAVFDEFGWAVAASGSTVVVSAFRDTNANDFQAGSAYVFTRPGTGWTGTLNETAKLLASDGAFDDTFGISVAISGSTVVVGAEGDENVNGDAGGAAYVFVEPGGGWSGTLNENAKLLASDGHSLASFGNTVGVSGSTVVVGAPITNDTGAAYVFTEPDGGWAGTLTETAKLVSSDLAVGDRFGSSVAVSGNTAVVGAPHDGSERGAGYVFVDPGGWTGTTCGATKCIGETAKLLASVSFPGDDLGESIAIDDSTVVAGTTDESAYVFVKPGGGWTGTLNHTSKLVASDGAIGDWFGLSVAVSGSSVVVGAFLDDFNAFTGGSAYAFVEPSGGWAGTLNETSKLLVANGEAVDLGFSVSVSGDTVVVGAPEDGNRGSAPLGGSAFVFNFAPCTGTSGDLTLMDDTVLDEQSYYYCGTITAGPNYAVSGPNGDLTLRAPNGVVLSSGFSVGIGGVLTVRVD
jgi:hypothetical protein